MFDKPLLFLNNRPEGPISINIIIYVKAMTSTTVRVNLCDNDI